MYFDHPLWLSTDAARSEQQGTEMSQPRSHLMGPPSCMRPVPGYSIIVQPATASGAGARAHRPEEVRCTNRQLSPSWSRAPLSRLWELCHLSGTTVHRVRLPLSLSLRPQRAVSDRWFGVFYTLGNHRPTVNVFSDSFLKWQTQRMLSLCPGTLFPDNNVNTIFT